MPRRSDRLKAYCTAQARLDRTETRGNPAVGVGVFLPPPVLSGIAVTPQRRLTFAACFACINVIATDCAHATPERRAQAARRRRRVRAQ